MTATVLVTTEDEECGVQLALTECPDVILLDIHLPGTSGLDRRLPAPEERLRASS
jgi:CheY-like chemotaxis protein